ncbi:MAG: hypothetical protein JSU63_11085 [Phycisphaerales bacterium]|nr:MAG: hypothetical protein JSU63_11085 [Phycisphaerales bacterium]
MRTLEAVLVLTLFITNPSLARGDDSNPNNNTRRDILIEDVRQLADILEDSHPDPYTHGGGRIAFHLRLHQLLNSIPEHGMTIDEFITLLRPFIAAVGDQHTSIYTAYDVTPHIPGGLPYVFRVVERSLYVYIPFLRRDQEQFGSLLVSVEGVPVNTLIARFAALEGVENEYFALRRFCETTLQFQSYLKELLPEWEDTGKVTFELRRPTGEIEQVTRKLPIALTAHTLRPPKSSMTLPTPGPSGFLCDFIDPTNRGEETAYLRVDHMQGYREAYEMSVAVGRASYSTEQLATFSSATEEFRKFVQAMKQRNTQTVLIDLRKNGGGNATMSYILLYFLYGKEMLTSIARQGSTSGGGHGVRYSSLYFDEHPKITLDSINRERTIPLRVGDIDFARIFSDLEGRRDTNGQLRENPERLKMFKRAVTFYQEYQSGSYSGHYCPKNVLVLMTPWTSSSGLDMALALYRCGAILVGTPSAQAPNSTGELLEWELKNTGINGEVASAFDIAFGNDPEKGRVLPVHYPLSYEKLKYYKFDPNAEVYYAFEISDDLERGDR